MVMVLALCRSVGVNTFVAHASPPSTTAAVYGAVAVLFVGMVAPRIEAVVHGKNLAHFLSLRLLFDYSLPSPLTNVFSVHHPIPADIERLEKTLFHFRRERAPAPSPKGKPLVAGFAPPALPTTTPHTTTTPSSHGTKPNAVVVTVAIVIVVIPIAAAVARTVCTRFQFWHSPKEIFHVRQAQTSGLC